MVYSIGFSCNSASEGVRLINVFRNLATCSVIFFRSYWPFQRMKFISNEVCTKFSGAATESDTNWCLLQEAVQPGVRSFLSSLFIYKRHRSLWIILSLTI